MFHRVERGFVIQGGGYTESLAEKPTRAADPERGHQRAAESARHAGAWLDARQLRSATSQFYFNVANNGQLDHRGYTPSEFGYAVFGRVLAGMDVVDRIANVPVRTAGDLASFPAEPIVITGVKVREAK